MGRKPVAAHILSYLFGQPGVKIAGVITDSHLDRSPTASIAARLGLPLFTFQEALDSTERGDLEFDIGLSVLYWRKLRGALLSTPRYGVINFHPAPLPEYKGVGGYNLCILEGLEEWAVSAHYVDQEIDTGPIIAVDRFAIDPDLETALSLEAKSMKALEVQAKRVCNEFLADPRQLPTTPNVGGRYLSRSELEAMKTIDPSRDELARKIRAFWFPPYDGAYLELQGERVTLVNRTILSELGDPESAPFNR